MKHCDSLSVWMLIESGRRQLVPHCICSIMMRLPVLVLLIHAGTTSATTQKLPQLWQHRDVDVRPQPPHVESLSVDSFNIRPAGESKEDALKRATKTLEDTMDPNVNPCEVC